MNYTDEEIVQAVRDAISLEACRNCVCQYPGSKLIVDPKATARHGSVVAWAFYHRMPGLTPSAMRKRLKKLAEKGHFTLKQWGSGHPLVLHLRESDALELVELGRRWWLAMGFSVDEALPFDREVHVAAQNEADLRTGWQEVLTTKQKG